MHWIIDVIFCTCITAWLIYLKQSHCSSPYLPSLIALISDPLICRSLGWCLLSLGEVIGFVFLRRAAGSCLWLEYSKPAKEQWLMRETLRVDYSKKKKKDRYLYIFVISFRFSRIMMGNTKPLPVVHVLDNADTVSSLYWIILRLCLISYFCSIWVASESMERGKLWLL